MAVERDISGLFYHTNKERRLGRPEHWLAALLCAFFFWGLFGLTTSPGFSADEPEIADAAMSLATRGYLSVTSAGSGAGHEIAYLYQLPLHPILLAGVYRVFGCGLLQGRMLSLVFALFALALVWLCGRQFSPRAALISALLLAVDPVFTERARIIRYDWPALLCMLGGWYLLLRLWGRSPDVGLTSRERRTQLFFVGVLLGIGASAHVLVLCFAAVVLSLVWLMAFRQNRSLGESLADGSAVLGGSFMALIPVMAYIATHWLAFTHQFLVQVRNSRLQQQSALLWMSQEATKYFHYYRLTPTILLLALASIIIAVRLLLSARNEQASSRESLLLFAILYVSVALPVGLGFVSGHRPWHHLIAAPFWSLLCGVVVDRAMRSPSRILRKTAFVAIIFTLANGFVYSWAGRSYSVLYSWGTRDIDRLTPRIDEIVPEKAQVWGDYRLLFHARKRGWSFVTVCNLPRNEDVKFPDMRFEFVILSDMVGAPDWLDMSRYERVATMNLPPSPFSLVRFNPRNRPIALSIYRRKDLAPTQDTTGRSSAALPDHAVLRFPVDSYNAGTAYLHSLRPAGPQRGIFYG